MRDSFLASVRHSFPWGPRRGSGAHLVVALASMLLLGLARQAQSQTPVPKRPLGRDIPVYLPAAGEVRSRDAGQLQNPAGTLSLRDAVALALLQNPVLAAFAWEIRAREARALQARRLPNPSLSTLFEDLGASELAGGDLNEPIQPQTTVQLTQLVELGGKRGARSRLAGFNRDLAAWDYEAARIDVLTEVTQAFIDVLAAQEGVTQIERTSGLVDEVRQSVASRVVAGVVSPIEETRATVAAAAIRVDLARARRTLEASRSRLALFWGSPTAAFTAAEGTLQIVPPPAPPLTVLVGKLEQNPEIARWAAEIAQRRASVAVERGKRIPDLSLSAGYRRFTALSTSALVVGATISLPLFDGNGSGIREARIRAARADEERRATESRALAALADGYAALTSAIDEVNTLSQSVLPGSQQTFEAISEGYRLGRFSYLDVLDAQRTLIGARSQYLRALADYRKGVANVERLIGAPLHDAAIGTTATK